MLILKRAYGSRVKSARAQSWIYTIYSAKRPATLCQHFWTHAFVIYSLSSALLLYVINGTERYPHRHDQQQFFFICNWPVCSILFAYLVWTYIVNSMNILLLTMLLLTWQILDCFIIFPKFRFGFWDYEFTRRCPSYWSTLGGRSMIEFTNAPFVSKNVENSF